MIARITAVVPFAFVLSTVVVAQDWPNWRGPSFDGSSPGTGLPKTFGPDDHVRWTLDLPGPAASTPIILGDRVFLTSADTEAQELVTICADARSGEVLWRKVAGSGFQPDGDGSRIALEERSTYASPSPVADGERVVCFFGNGDLVAFDLDGEELWRRNLQQDYGRFAFQWTFSATPTLHGGRLFLPVLQRDVSTARGRRGGGPSATDTAAADDPIDSFVLAIDPATGETIFRHVRPSSAQLESRESYGTMIPRVRADGRDELLLIGGDVITGHDPKTGAELWRWGTWNPAHREQWWRVVPSPVFGDGVALVCAPKREPVYAVRLDGEGDLGEKGLVWQSDGRPNNVSSDVPTPAFHDGHFYVLSDVRVAISKVRAKDGEVVWSVELPSDHLWRASPTVADGRVWIMNHNGLLAALSLEDGAITHAVRMAGEDDDQICSTVAVAHGALFVRTNDKLFCLGEPIVAKDGER